MKTIQKISIAFIASFFLLMPQLVFAQGTPTTPKTKTPATTPKTTQTTPAATTSTSCGDLEEKFTNSGGTDVIADVPKYCSVESLYKKIMNLALFAIGIVAVIAIIYGGYVYMTSRGNAAQTAKGRSILTWAIIGLIVVLAAALIVNVVVKALVENPFV